MKEIKNPFTRMSIAIGIICFGHLVIKILITERRLTSSQMDNNNDVSTCCNDLPVYELP